MNVDDIKYVPGSTDILKDIFQRQSELMEKYGPIEHSMLRIDALNIQPGEKSIDDPVMQFKVKEHLWRVTEELAESFEVHWTGLAEGDVHFQHQIEELSDALHFMVETMILVGIKVEDIENMENRYDEDYYTELAEEGINTEEIYNYAFFRLGMIGNCLKNKPWKQTQMRTDSKKFFKCVNEAFDAILHVFFYLGLTPEEVYAIYFKKSEVNKFRQRSNY